MSVSDNRDAGHRTPVAASRSVRAGLRRPLFLLAFTALAVRGLGPPALSADVPAAVIDQAASSSCSSRRRSRTLAKTPASAAASYARYSSDLQRPKSIGDQRRECRDRAAADGNAIDPEFEFADAAVSGARADRDGLAALMAAARARRYSVLYFENLSRLARESVITLPLLKELVHVCGVRIVSVTEGIDSDRDGWEVLAAILSLQHEQYLKYLGQSVRRGHVGNLEDGFSVGDWCFGYRSEPVPGTEARRRGRDPKPRMHYAVDDAQAAWVVRVFVWFALEGRGQAWIARELNRRGAPKDHRASTPHWRHDLVTSLLRNRKYVGVWPWGEMKNVRNPLTGRIRQEPRPESECEKWTRDLPHLRIVEDGLFETAQRKLDEQAERCADRRGEKGKLAGSAAGGKRPRHLLQELFACRCGATFQVAGAKGQYLGCGHAKAGACGVRTKLRRDVARKVLLDDLGHKILACPKWKAAVQEELLAAWRTRQANGPEDLAALERRLVEAERRVANLLDRIEQGDSDADLDRRYEVRKAEREGLRRERDEARRRSTDAGPEPSLAWLEGKLAKLGEVLVSDTPAAADTLKRLVGGGIRLEEVSTEGRKRRHLRGTFTLSAARVVDCLADGSTGPSLAAHAGGETITLDFAEPPPWAALADAAKALFDEGVDYAEMAVRLGCVRSQVAKALAWWHAERGLPAPDGRSHRGRLDEPLLAESLAHRAQGLWDAGLLIQEIAADLGCDRNTVTAAVRHWYASRGLQCLDGRSRRKELRPQAAS